MLTDGQEILEGRFQIVKKLGSGAFGEIYKGKFALPSAAAAASTGRMTVAPRTDAVTNCAVNSPENDVFRIQSHWLKKVRDWGASKHE